jgi:hypothetical protein
VPSSGTTISVTFRLPADLAGKLLEASLRRKLRREEPFTQRDIIAEALLDWLKKAGFSI